MMIPDPLRINSLGEVLEHGCLISGGISIPDVRHKYLTATETRILENVIPATPDERKRIERKEQRGCSREYDNQIKDALTPEQCAVVKHIWLLQKPTNGMFRVYGGIRRNGRKWAWLVCEFAALVENKQFWHDLKHLQKAAGARCEIMHELPFLDNVIVNYGTPEEYQRTGPNHGKMERQVEFSWPVYDLTLPELRQKMRHLKKLLMPLYDEYGVDVV